MFGEQAKTLETPLFIYSAKTPRVIFIKETKAIKCTKLPGQRLISCYKKRGRFPFSIPGLIIGISCVF